MHADKEAFFNMLDTIYAFTRLSSINQSMPRRFLCGELLNVTEVYCLHVIGENDNVTVTELAQRNRRTLSSLSQIVTKLQKKGLISRHVSDTDKKTYYLKLTEKGHQLLEEHTRDDHEYYTGIFEKLGDFSNHDIEQVMKLIHVLEDTTLKAIELKNFQKKYEPTSI